MFKVEYTLLLNGMNYYFNNESASLELLKRNMKDDILSYCKKNHLEGDIDVEATILYNEEYYDMDSFTLNISLEEENVELLAI